MRKETNNLLYLIKDNSFIYHLTDIDKNVLDNEKMIDSYMDELILNNYFKAYKKEYIKNLSGRVYKIKYIVGDFDD